MDQKKIGAFLKQLRNEKGLTQEQLAENFHVSTRTISRWETGSNMPDVSMLVEIAEFYDVDVREIIEGERKNEKMDEELKAKIKVKAMSSLLHRNVLGALGMLLPVFSILGGLFVRNKPESWWYSISVTYYITPALPIILGSCGIFLFWFL